MSDNGNTNGFNIDELYQPVNKKHLRRLPRLVVRSLQLSWRAARREFATTAALQFGAAGALALQVLVGKKVLDGVLSGGTTNFAGVLPSLVALATATALVSFANVAQAEKQRVLGELVGRYAQRQVLEVATAVALIAYEHPGFHDRLQRAAVNAYIRPLQMANGILGIISSFLAIAGLGAALLFLKPLFLVLVIVAYIPAWIATKRASAVGYQFAVQQTERDRRRDYLFRLLTGKEEAKEVRSFDLASFLRARYDRLFDERILDLRRLCRRRLIFGLAGAVATSALTAGTIATLVWFVTTDQMPLAAAGAAAGAIVLLGQRLQGLSSSIGALYESSLFLEDFTSFVETMPALVAAQPKGEAPPGFKVLSVDDVSFTYPSRQGPTLRSVSMEIHQGEIVALVGENGSGKTTLAKLLAGLYQPQAGAITWDGADIGGFAPEQLRDSVAVIFQDFVKYHLSAAENIGMGRHGNSDDMEAIAAAARQAGAHTGIESLKDSYATRLGSEFFGGSDLSVGQWQRIALARAFFRDAPFLILDEPTAALDPRAESELFDRMRLLCAGRSVLLISHRFSSVRSADRIYVLRDGEMVERGTHSDLMAQAGCYAELFTLQAAAYLDLDLR